MIQNYLDFHRSVAAGNFKRIKEFYNNGGKAFLNKSSYLCIEILKQKAIWIFSRKTFRAQWFRLTNPVTTN